MRIARGCLNETHFFLRQAYRRNLMTRDEVVMAKELLALLSPTINAYLDSIENRRDPSKGTPKAGNGRRTGPPNTQ